MTLFEIPKISYKINQFLIFILVSLILNHLMTIYLYSWVTDDDISGLPPKDSKIVYNDRFIALFYFNAITLSTLGYEKIIPISNRARMHISLYTIVITAGLISSINIYE
jgi:hypothetical protein